MPQRVDPIVLPAAEPPEKPEHSAAIIFMHGLGDEGAGWESVGRQFQAAKKLPYMQWIFPTALENRDAMENAWYTPSGLAAVPPSRPELAEDEDEDGMLQSRKYIEGLVDDLVRQGVPANRIVIAGFSQGCAMTLLTGLTSPKYSGKVAGLLGLMGYLPLAERISEMRKEEELSDEIGDVPIFVIKGGKDMLIPRRFWTICQEKLKELGVKDELLEFKEYEGVGHQVTPAVLQDVSAWLEKVVPPV